MSRPGIDTRAWGIDAGYFDRLDEWHDAPPKTVDRILDAMGADATAPPGSRVSVLSPGRAVDLSDAVEVVTEDGGSEPVDDRLPADLPNGYHGLVHRDGSVSSLIVSPGRCNLPKNLRSWGWAVQLYSVRSNVSWGIGDARDLATIAAWARRSGAGVLLVNPLHAVNPGPQEPSPYFPSSRSFTNPLYVSIEDVPGARDPGRELRELTAAGRELNDGDLVDRDAVYELKMNALEELWTRFPGSAEFDEWRAGRGDTLEHFATYQALAERFGGGTDVWEPGYEDARSAAVAAFRTEHRARVSFHAWIQWLLEKQLDVAASAIRLVNDIAVGVDEHGFDAWMWRDVLAKDVTIGAPPDEYSSGGQDWRLPPFDPWKLRAAGYEPFIEVIRSALHRHGGARIDHVMGLFRLWWIPDGEPATAGAYVRYPHDDLLDIVALESERSGAFVVGEDLGTVEPEVRDEMDRRRMLSYRVMWFEDDDPSEYPHLSLAAVTNHDLPTIAGVWTGADLADQRAAGLDPPAEGAAALKERLVALGLSPGAPVEEVVRAAYAVIARARSEVVLATVEDGLGVGRRPNLPGTTPGERANWCTPLPKPLEEILEDPLVRDVAGALAAGRSGRTFPA